jgi:hypothetical protein
MSEIFEGIVYPTAEPRAADRALTPGPPLETRILDHNLAVSFRQDPRARAAFSDQMDGLAAEYSRHLGKALLVRFDSRIGHRSAELFERGRHVRSFGETDELYVPLDERGMPIGTAKALPADQLDPTVEYETSTNAIQLGLRSLAADGWDSLFAVMTSPT